MKYLYLFILFICLILIGGVSAVGTYPAVDPNMVLYYHFNNDSSVGENYFISPNIYDYSNNKQNGTILYNMTLNSTGDILGNGTIVFNYTRTVITLPTNEYLDLNYTKDFAVNIWVNKFSGINTSVMPLIGVNQKFGIQLKNNQVQFGLRNISGTREVQGITILQNNTWYMITGVFNSTSQNMTLYVDGVLQGETYAGDINFSVNNVALRIGDTVYAGTLQPLNLSIDDLIIYNKTLSQDEVISMYTNYVECITPTDNMEFTSNAPLCYGTYNLNGSSTGVINIKSNNIILNCNNAVLIGNLTTDFYGVYILGYKNIEIKNCNFVNYSGGIFAYLESTKDIFIHNNTFFDIKNTPIGARRTSNIFIYNNSINYSKSSGDAQGIFLNRVNSSLITNNIINNARLSIYLSNDAGTNQTFFNNITDNYITNSNYSGIELRVGACNNNILNNFINNSGHNGITIGGGFNNLSYNNISFTIHHGIDLFSCSSAYINSNGNYVYKNNVFYTNADEYSSFLYICNASNNIIDSNNFSYALGDSSDSISIDIGSDNNIFSNNYVNNVSKNFIHLGKGNNNSILNNIFINNYGTYYFDFSYNIPNTEYDTANYNNSGSFSGNNFLNFTYKNFYGKYNKTNNYDYFLSLDNITDNITNINYLSSPLLTFSNGSSIYLSGTNLEYNLTLNPNEWVYVFDDFNKVENYSMLVGILGQSEVSRIYNQLGWTEVRSIESCHSGSTILLGFIVMIPIIIIIVIFTIIFGFKNGLFEKIDGPERILPILATIIFLTLVIGIGSVIVFSIAGC